MIIKIKVDDFWLDEEQELEPALKAHIVTSAVVQIRKEIEEKVDVLLVKHIGEAVDKLIEPVIAEQISQFIEKGVVNVPGTYSSDKVIEMTLNEYLQSLFIKFKGGRHGWDAKEHIERYCKKFGENIKLQYNAAFANQIVANLKEQGMLKDEVVNALLTGPTK